MTWQVAVVSFLSCLHFQSVSDLHYKTVDIAEPSVGLRISVIYLCAAIFSRFTKLFFEIIFFRWQTPQIPSNFTLRKNLTFSIIIFPMVWFIFTQWKPQLNQKCLCTLLCARMQSMSGYTNKSQQRGKQSRVWFNQTRECRFSFTSTDLLQFT